MRSNAAYDALLARVCVGLGFCGCLKEGTPLHVDAFIPPTGPVTADQFVEWVLLADNMNPNTEEPRLVELKRRIRDAFVENMGAEVVDATLLR